ncbi:hypothetical protein H2248_007212 [Termitomyces sp. 'cryptogamus']|nr:hypothetical protein H2248_007212 [Termitomyces sp. 'cryptogamus']
MEAADRGNTLTSTLGSVAAPSPSIEQGKRPRCTPEESLDQNKPSAKKPRYTLDSNACSVIMKQDFEAHKRDPEYYFDDGSCIFLVEDTLFKVHRSRLCNDSRQSKDSNSFGTMFSLPQGRLEVEGKSDENPIVLIGNTPSEFRHFLWSFYALPPEINKASENLPLMIDIARVSHKYDFKDLETWALNTIHEYVNRKPSPILAANPPAQSYTFSFHGMASNRTKSNDATTIQNTEELTTLIRLAHLCNHEPLLTTLISHLKQLMSSSVQYAYIAMTLADELDLRSLRGVAYLEVMQKATVVKRTKTDIELKAMTTQLSSTTADTIPFVPGLPAATEEGTVDEEDRLVISRAQQLRLLSGYYRLTSTWERLRTTPPAFDHSSSCGATWHQHGCTQSWVEFWKEKTRIDAVLALGLTDVVGRLKQIHKEYERWGSVPYMHFECRNAARNAILEVIRKIEDGLPDFFSDGEEEDEW